MLVYRKPEQDIFISLYHVTGIPWLVLSLAFPGEFTVIKYVLLILIIVVVVTEILVKDLKFNKNILLGVLLILTTNLLYLLYSCIKSRLIGIQIDYSLIKMFIFTPIVAFLLSNIIRDKEMFLRFFKLLLIITFFIVFLDSFYVLGRLLSLSWLDKINLSIFGSFKFQEEYIEARITNHSSLIFLLPVVVFINLVNAFKDKLFLRLNSVTLILGIFVTLVSGRRALQLSVLLSFFLSFVFILFLRLNINKKVIKNMFFLFLFALLGLLLTDYLLKKFTSRSIEDILVTFLKGFDWEFTSSGQVRILQTQLLVRGWLESPFVGHGLGSFISTFIRSVDTPWSYEMVYLSLLYQLGIIGVVVYIIILVSIIIAIIKKILKYKDISFYFLSILSGFVCFIVAGATNPLVDYVWVWSIVLACIKLF